MLFAIADTTRTIVPLVGIMISKYGALTAKREVWLKKASEKPEN